MRIFLFLFLCISWIGLFAQKGYQPQATSVVVDGDDGEWTVGEQMFHRENQLTYAFRQDAENLYVLVKTSDRRALMQIAFTGLEIWAHPDGKKRRSYGLMYPVPRDKRLGQQMPNQAPDLKKVLEQNPDRIKLTNLFGDERGAILADLSQLDQPLEVKHQLFDDGFWVYELSIPLSAFPVTKKSKKGVWQVGITTPDLSEIDDMPSGMTGGGMRDPSMPGGGIGGMGMGGSMPPGGMRGPTRLSSLSVWTKVLIKK